MLVDVLFVQESKHIEPSCPIHLMPMGVPSMAAFLDRHGIATEIVHHAIELALDPDFDICACVRESGAKLVCLPLHWHATSRTVVNLARDLKRESPDVKICLGGYTASSFGEEILREFPFIDFVIRGDGERALLALARHVLEAAPVSEVPNLTRIVDGQYVVSEVQYVNTGLDLADYEFCRFDLMRHFEHYCQRGLMEGKIALENREPGIFYCNAGRGCPYDCTFCGGSRTAQNFISGRQNVAWRPVNAMMRDLARMAEFNLDTWYNTYQPTPVEDWFREMFAAIRKAGLRMKMVQECLHIPSREWIEDFSRTFLPGSRLDFVMYNGDDALRKLNKKNYFSAQAILDVLQITEPLGIKTDLCFLTGLPFEQLEHFDEHFRLIDKLRREYDLVGVNCEILAIEPRAPMNVDEKRHLITSHAKTFKDFYELHKEPVFIGYTPGRYSARVAQVLAAYTRVAHRCEKETCKFTAALAEDPRRLTTVPVGQWKEYCRGCEHHRHCFSDPLYSEIDMYEGAQPEKQAV
jgi:B12 binding domain